MEAASEREQAAWVLFGLSFASALVLGFFLLRKPNNVTIETVKTVEKPVEVIKTVEVPKEVVRIVSDPKTSVLLDVALEENKRLEKALDKVLKAPTIPPDYRLAGIKNVKVTVVTPENGSDYFSESRIKDVVELKLRSLGIPISTTSFDEFTLVISGMWMEEQRITYFYSCNTTVDEDLLKATYLKSGSLSYGWLRSTIWSKGLFGYAGKKALTDAVEQTATRAVEAFANAYLAANPK